MTVENQEFKVGGTFTYEHIRNGEVIDTWDEKNLVVDEGLNYILGAGLAGTTPLTNWYVGLFKNNYTPVAANVAATFPGVGVANEATTEYTQTNRPLWVSAGVSSKTITNSASTAVFTFGTVIDVYGAFLSSASAKGATSGVLAAASKFGAVRSMLIGDTLNVTYSLSISSS